MDELDDDADVCRVCRFKGTPSKPLYNPCVCSGSIKYTHNDCLIRWLNQTKRDMCELCNHHIAFSTIYAHGMPSRLPFNEVLSFICMVIMKRVVFDVRCYLVIAMWLYVVPLIEWRLHQCMFNGTFEPLTSLRVDLWSLRYISDDLMDGLPTLVLSCIFFVGLLLVNREVMFSYGVDGMRPNYEELVMDRFFHRDGEEEGDEVDDLDVMKSFTSKMIGSKGLLVFLKHVFLIILLNTVCVFLLLLCPCRIGKLAINTMALQDKVLALHFDGLLTTMFGYCLIATFLFVVHAVSSFIGLGSYKQFIWHCYTVIKVSIMMVVLIGVIPFLIALWMDICSLSMFDISVKERIQNFYDSPENFLFLHWLTGVTSLCFFIPIFEVFHIVTRPGLLWFLKNLIDYEDWYSWPQELIKENMFYHGRKIIVSTTLYGTVIFVLVWIPARIVKCVWPSFLPYTAPTEGYYLDEWSSLIRLLLVTMLKQDVVQYWTQRGVKSWCANVSRVLGMESYLLLGDAAPPEADDDDDDDTSPPPYVRPAYLVPRLFAVLVVAILTAAAIGVLAITVPVCAIRLVMWLLAMWLPAAPVAKPYRQMHVGEICMTLFNMFMWCTCAGFVYSWLRAVWTDVRAAAAWCWRLFSGHPSRVSVASVGLLFVAPRLVAVLIHLIVVVPSAVPAHQSPVIREMQDAVFRLCCVGLSVLLFVFAPTRPLGRAYADGLADFRLANYRLAAGRVAAPAACAVSMLLAVPYMVAYSAVPFVIGCRRTIPSSTFPLLVGVAVTVKSMMMIWDMYMSIQKRILDDKYRLGKQLVNYEPKLAIA